MHDVLRHILEQTRAKPSPVDRHAWSGFCPAHQDNRPSLSIRRTANKILVCCHAGCPVESIVRALGLSMSQLFLNGRAPQQNASHTTSEQQRSTLLAATADAAVDVLARRYGAPSAVYWYESAGGERVGAVLRWDTASGKTIRPIARHADGWHCTAMQAPRPIYRLRDVLRASEVVIVEGEKVVDVLCEHGVVATTSAGGSNAAAKSDWTPLAGRHVTIVPDHDESGRSYATQVAQLCESAGAASVVIVDVMAQVGGEPGDDLADVLAEPGWRGLATSGNVSLLSVLRRLRAAVVQRHSTTTAPRKHESLEFRDYPVDVFPAPVHDALVELAESIGCDVCYVALPWLAACAAAIGSTYRLSLKPGWTACSVLWCAVIGESGTAKTPALTAVMQPLYRRQEAAIRTYREQRAMYEQQKKASQAKEEDAPTLARYIVSDTTVEALAPVLRDSPRGVLLLRDELGGWVASFDRYRSRASGISGDVAHWLAMHTGQPLVIDRKTGERVIYVPSACVSIIGGIQPALLPTVFSDAHRSAGLLARILLAYPPRRKLAWNDRGISAATWSSLARVLDHLYSLPLHVDETGRPLPTLAILSDDAKQAWRHWYDAHAEALVEVDGEYAAAFAKLHDYAARLALVVHLMRWAAGEQVSCEIVDEESVQRGVRIVEWHAHEVQRLYLLTAVATSTKHRPDLDAEVVAWLLSRGGCARVRDIQRRFRRIGSAQDVRRFCDVLVARGLATWRDESMVVLLASGGRDERGHADGRADGDRCDGGK